MALRAEVLRALQAAGATIEMILAAVQAEQEAERLDALAADEARKARARDGNRERQARFRAARQADVTEVTDDNAVTHRDDRYPPPKDNNQTPHHDSPADPNGSSAPKPRKARNRALPADWHPGERSDRVRAELGRSTEWMNSTATAMRVWAESKGEVRSDWDATHDGWMRREAKRECERSPDGRTPPRGPPPGRRTSNGGLSLLASLNGADHDPSGSFHDDRTLDHDPSDGRSRQSSPEPDGRSSGYSREEARFRLVRTG